MSGIALPSLDDATALTGLDDPDAIVDFYLGLGPSVVALKLGSRGVLVATAGERRRIAGHTVAAVDATGAGDTFDGAFLARLVAGDGPFDAARYANAAAAVATQGYGAVAPIPTREAVASFLQELPEGDGARRRDSHRRARCALHAPDDRLLVPLDQKRELAEASAMCRAKASTAGACVASARRRRPRARSGCGTFTRKAVIERSCRRAKTTLCGRMVSASLALR